MAITLSTPVKFNPRDAYHIREKIRTASIVQALQNHILKRKKMGATQIAAARILLAKVIPDLRVTELVGEGGGPLGPNLTVIVQQAVVIQQQVAAANGQGLEDHSALGLPRPQE